MARAREQATLAPLLETFRLDVGTRVGRCAAQGAWIERATGLGWIAVGDAALACDPLSGRGLFNALYTALLGAGAVREVLGGGGMGALRDYQSAVDRVKEASRDGLRACYGLETRWTDRPFWSRRVNCAAPFLPAPETPVGGLLSPRFSLKLIPIENDRNRPNCSPMYPRTCRKLIWA
jgi:hypothetical protein